MTFILAVPQIGMSPPWPRHQVISEQKKRLKGTRGIGAREGYLGRIFIATDMCSEGDFKAIH